MWCNHCGAQLPDGSRFCTICGATQPQTNGGFQSSNLEQWRRNEQERQQYQQTKAFMLLDSLRKISNYKMATLIVTAILSLISLLMLNSLGGLDWDSVTGILFLIGIAAIILIVFEILTLLEIKKAGEYDAGFEMVYKLFLTYIVLGVLSYFLEDPISSLADIAQLVIGIAYVYYFYKALADVVRPISGTMAGKWEGLFKFYILSNAISIISALFAAIKAIKSADSYLYDLIWDYVGVFFWISVIATVVSIIISIVEVVFLRETVRKIETGCQYPGDRGMHL